MITTNKNDDIMSELILGYVNDLIKWLYVPSIDEDGKFKAVIDKDRMNRFGINYENEPINWGKLKCYEIIPLKDGTYIAMIEEAAPGRGSCPTFCNYIQKY